MGSWTNKQRVKCPLCEAVGSLDYMRYQHLPTVHKVASISKEELLKNELKPGDPRLAVLEAKSKAVKAKGHAPHLKREQKMKCPLCDLVSVRNYVLYGHFPKAHGITYAKWKKQQPGTPVEVKVPETLAEATKLFTAPVSAIDAYHQAKDLVIKAREALEQERDGLKAKLEVIEKLLNP